MAATRTLRIGPRAVDSALVLVCLALTGFALKTPWSTLPWPVVLVAGVIGSAAQLVRRKWPPVAATLGAAAFPLSGNPGPWFVGVYSGAAYAPRRHVWGYALVGWAGLATALWIEAGRIGVDDGLYAVAATALLVGIGIYLATRRALLVSLHERAEQAQAERWLREDRARTAERARIAREMHDVLAHKVSLIALHAGALELGAGTDPDRVQQAAGLIRVTAREALQELRTVLGVLNGEPPGSTGSAGDREPGAPFADLTALVQASTHAGQRVELDDRAGPLPPATARVVYRIAQEGLTNAHRYAPQAPTTVSVERDGDGGVTVTVRNAAGTGASADLPGSGSGLVGLAERIRLVGGSMHSGPLGPGGRDGWQLQAVVPWLEEYPARQPTPIGSGTRAPEPA